ncbi:hypothetical protein [Ralstonia phage RP12]|uniref:Uncharacterized protein n=1 Tax=Ralstonia phage RP12 TaxID=1923889 RepID=A0A1L7N0M2_9CAUD|nr:hypothetical protein FDH28_gp034 [Ralstonia phage RP12]BAW19008.1 hypothetical protein [Ralstonia phage RP12]
MSEANNVAAAEATVEIKFKDDLVQLADKLKGQITIDNATGVMTLPAGAFFEHAPEGLTEASYKRDREYTDLFSNAATKAGSEVAVDAFKGNKDLQSATLNAPIFKKDSYEGVFKRTGTSRNVKTGEVSNYVGSIGVGRINVVSTRTQTEWAAIKNNMKALAEAADL